MTQLSVIYLVIYILVSCCVHGRNSEEYEHPISFLDGDSMRSMYRSFRDFAMRIIGQTGRRTRGAFLQDTDTEFPCNKTGMRSTSVPTSVHHLKPGRNLIHTIMEILFFKIQYLTMKRHCIDHTA